MEWFLKVIRDNYFNFSGRARRKEYWMFTLISTLLSWALTAIDFFLFRDLFTGTGIGVLSTIFSLAIFIPSIAVVVRRLHDVGRSGWWYFIILTIIGIIPLFIWLVSDSQVGENQWGPDPKAGEIGH